MAQLKMKTEDATDLARLVLPCELVDLGQVADPALFNILMPRTAYGTTKVGITDQFLRDAHIYHKLYSCTSYCKWQIEQATRGRYKTEPSIIIDIGSGAGNSVLPCLELFPCATIIATDLSENLLAILRDYVATNPDDYKRLALICMDATGDNHFAEKSVDLVVGAAILHHLIDPALCIRNVCRALRPGGMAIFFEPFEYGNALLRLAYEQILSRCSEEGADPQYQLAPEVMNFLRAMIEDYRIRTGCDKSDPIFKRIDDKWLFTRSYFQNLADSLAGISLEIEPLKDPTIMSDKVFTIMTKNNLRRAPGLSTADADTALPDWAWGIIRSFDEVFSEEAKQEMPTHARVTFIRHT